MSTEELVISVLCKGLSLDARQINGNSHFVEDLGADELDVCQIVLQLEEAFGVYIPDGEGEQIQTVGDAAACVQGCLSRDAVDRSLAEAPAVRDSVASAPAAAERNAAAARAHVLRCVVCFEPIAFPEELPPGWVSCPGCASRFVNLGVLPEPNWQVVTRLVLGAPRVARPEPRCLGAMPRWVCSWCGRNLGIPGALGTAEHRCQRCRCDLRKYAAISLRDRVRGLVEFQLGVFYQQAVQSMNGASALQRLGRVSPKKVRWLESWGQTFPPPFANLGGDQRAGLRPAGKATRWWKFW